MVRVQVREEVRPDAISIISNERGDLRWRDILVLYYIVLHCIVLYNCIALHCIALHCIVLYCIVLYCIVLYCIKGN